MAHPTTAISTARLTIFPISRGDGVKPDFPKEMYVDTPTMNRKKGNTKSQGVIPFHTLCFNGAYESGPPGSFTKIIPATVIPRSTSSDNNLFIGLSKFS